MSTTYLPPHTAAGGPGRAPAPLGPRARATIDVVLAAYLRLARKPHGCTFARVPRVATEAKVSPRTVKSARAILEREGRIRCFRWRRFESDGADICATFVLMSEHAGAPLRAASDLAQRVIEGRRGELGLDETIGTVEFHTKTGRRQPVRVLARCLLPIRPRAEMAIATAPSQAANGNTRGTDAIRCPSEYRAPVAALAVAAPRIPSSERLGRERTTARASGPAPQAQSRAAESIPPQAESAPQVLSLQWAQPAAPQVRSGEPQLSAAPVPFTIQPTAGARECSSSPRPSPFLLLRPLAARGVRLTGEARLIVSAFLDALMPQEREALIDSWAFACVESETANVRSFSAWIADRCKRGQASPYQILTDAQIRERSRVRFEQATRPTSGIMAAYQKHLDKAIAAVAQLFTVEHKHDQIAIQRSAKLIAALPGHKREPLELGDQVPAPRLNRYQRFLAPALACMEVPAPRKRVPARTDEQLAERLAFLQRQARELVCA